MSEAIEVKTNFTAGQISEQIYGRGDLGLFENGARRLENIIIHPTGGISRRPGLRYINRLNKKTRLIAFEFNTEETYLICLSDKNMEVYRGNTKVASLETPWEEKHIFSISWTQSADTLLITHPDIAPKLVTRKSDANWQISDWTYHSESGMIFCPYFNFYKKEERIILHNNLGNISMSSDSPLFHSGYLGINLKINKGLFKITSINSPYNVACTLLVNPSSWEATTNWEEQAFSNMRGWPASVTFHQNRMVIGGSKSLPNRLWLSKSSDLFNFDLGKGLDDDAIEFGILSDQVNAIKSVVSGRHLLVFTTGAEWMVSGEPLAPASIQLRRQTTVGSYHPYNIPPQQIDGATVFVSHNGRQLREFLYTDLEQAYLAKDLTLLADDVVNQPLDAAFDSSKSILYLVLEDGSISALTSYRTEEVNAWSKITTKGNFISISITGDKTYACVYRNNSYFLEMFDDEIFSDCASKFNYSGGIEKITVTQYNNGDELSVSADGFNAGPLKVKDGSITLFEPAHNIVVGYPYEHVIEPLPYMAPGNKPYPPKAIRMVFSSFRILNSSSFCIDVGQGNSSVPLRKMSDDKILDAGLIKYSGDVNLRSLGWIRDMEKPMWSIKSNEPVAFTLLSVANEIKIKQ